MNLLRALVAASVLAVAAVLSVATQADAVISSGLPSGPVGTPVMLTPADADVMVVGDSITVRGYKDLAAALGGKRLAVNAQSGRNSKLSIDSLFKQMQAGMQLPPVLVMATGANDIFDSHATGAQVQRLLAGVPASTKVYWVDASVLRPAYRLADRFNSATVNAGIRRYCVGSCTVISWAGFLAAKSFRRALYIDSGGVHQTPAGAKAWGSLIAAGIR